MAILNQAAAASLAALGLLDARCRWIGDPPPERRDVETAVGDRGIWFSQGGAAACIGHEIAAIVSDAFVAEPWGPAESPAPWARFAWGAIADDFALRVPGSHALPSPEGEDARIVDGWMRSDARHALNEHIAMALGGRIVQFSGEGTHIVLCTPIADHRPEWAWVASRDATMAMCSQMGITLSTHTVFGCSHVAKAREKLLWDAMASDATHILFVDDDMGWNPRILMRLIAANMDLVAAVGVKKQDKLACCCNFLPNPQHFDPHTGFIEVQDVGFAFVLLKRSVVERMCEAYPELEYRTGGGREWALFIDMIDDGERLSEDFSFCRRWRKIGGKIFVDQDAALVHVGRKEYTGKPSDLFEPIRKDAAA